MLMTILQLNAEIAANSGIWVGIVLMRDKGLIVYYVERTHTILLSVQKKCALNATKWVTKHMSATKRMLKNASNAVMQGTLSDAA